MLSNKYTHLTLVINTIKVIHHVFSPLSKKTPEKLLRVLDTALYFSRMELTGEEWMSIVYASLLLFPLFLAPLSIITTNSDNILFITLVITIAVSSFIFYYPFIRKNALTGAIEKELPIALRTVATQLSMNLPFEICLESVSKGYGKLSDEIIEVVYEIKNGVPVQDALDDFAHRIDSKIVGRAVTHLKMCYEKGGDEQAAQSLESLANDLVRKQNADAKEFGGKLVMYSLVFIAVSVLLPALFQALIIVGSNFMDIGISPTQALLIPVIGFPLVDIIIMAWIRMRRPACI